MCVFAQIEDQSRWVNRRIRCRVSLPNRAWGSDLGWLTAGPPRTARSGGGERQRRGTSVRVISAPCGSRGHPGERAWRDGVPAGCASAGPHFYAVYVETLTFLFTDIEGSTALLGRLGDDDYAQLLAGHHALIRSALAAHGGGEVDTQGDAFFAVFSSPRGCLAAVLQQAIQAHAWPGRERVRVRMGIHCGEAARTAVGLEVPGRPGGRGRLRGGGAGVGGGGGAGAGQTADGRGAAGSRCPPAEGPGRSRVRRREEFATSILLCRTLTRGTTPANLTR
jgi:hypothetical protein